jgi:hypothetical protein
MPVAANRPSFILSLITCFDRHEMAQLRDKKILLADVNIFHF